MLSPTSVYRIHGRRINYQTVDATMRKHCILHTTNLIFAQEIKFRKKKKCVKSYTIKKNINAQTSSLILLIYRTSNIKIVIFSRKNFSIDFTLYNPSVDKY